MADKAILIQSLYAGLGTNVGNGIAKFLVSSGSSTYAKVYNSEEVSDDNLIDQSATSGVPLDEQGRAIVYGYDNYFLEIYNSEGIKQNFDSNLNYRSDTFDYIDVAGDYGITGEAVNQAIAVANSNSTRSYLMVFRDNEFNLLNNTIFPENTQLDIQKSAKLVLPSGTDSVTINGAIRCELYQLFKYDNNTTGTVTLNPKRHYGVSPQLFGGDPDGTTDVSFEVGRALATGVKRLVLTGGAYKLNSNITIPNDVEVIRIGGSDFSLATGVTVSGLGTKATVLDTLTVGTLNVTTNNSVSNSTATSFTTDDLIVNDDATITDDLTVNGDSFLKAVQTNNIVPEATGTRNIGTSQLEYLTAYFRNTNITTLATIAGLSVTELKSNLIPDTTNTKDIGSTTKKIQDIFTEGFTVTSLKSNLIPESNNTKDIGNNLKKFKDAYINGIVYAGQLLIDGTRPTKILNSTTEALTKQGNAGSWTFDLIMAKGSGGTKLGGIITQGADDTFTNLYIGADYQNAWSAHNSSLTTFNVPIKIKNTTTGQPAVFSFEAVAENTGTGNQGSMSFLAGPTGVTTDNEIHFNANHQTSTTPHLKIIGDGSIEVPNEIIIGSGRKTTISNNNEGMTKKGDSGGWDFVIAGARGSNGTFLGGFGAMGNQDSLYHWYIGTASNKRMVIEDNGRVTIGGGDGSTCALFKMNSTNSGFLPPRMTTTQRDAISNVVAGLVIYNTTTNKLNVYENSAWQELVNSTSATFSGNVTASTFTGDISDSLDFDSGTTLTENVAVQASKAGFIVGQLEQTSAQYIIMNFWTGNSTSSMTSQHSFTASDNDGAQVYKSAGMYPVKKGEYVKWNVSGEAGTLKSAKLIYFD